ncbi:MAG: conjugal transfer protein TraF [Candidatus Margulisbacteria bacterium]|nr:conjugal transfer protein TraF [Candidatus Margulisiibacteriota bacterium]
MSLQRTILSALCLGALALGSTAGSFLENPISVRSLAMGRVGAALAEGSAAYLNPGLIKLQEAQSYQIMQGQVLSEVNYFAFNYALNHGPFFDLGLGFSFLNSGVDGIQETTYDHGTGTAAYTGNEFGYAGRAYVFTTGLQALKNLYVGANLKVIQEIMHEQNSSGVGLDLGAVWQKDKLTLGLSILNLVQPQVTWSEGWTENLNTRVLIGLAYKILTNWTIYSDIEQNGERPVYYGLGTEFSLFDIVALRGGWNPDQFTLGTGLRWKNFSIDYAYLLNEDQSIGASHFIAIAYLLDNTQELSRLEQEERARQKLLDAIEAEKQRQELELTASPAAVTPDVTTPDAASAEIVTVSAEIHPLPVQKELFMETVTLDRSSPENAVLDPVEPVLTTLKTVSAATVNAAGETQIIQEIIEDEEVSVNIGDDTGETAGQDYEISMVSARYYYQSGRLQSNIYLDNTGSQPTEVHVDFRLLNSANEVLLEERNITANINAQKTKVLRIPYDAPLPAGVYYLEAASRSPVVSKYQKEQFVKNN